MECSLAQVGANTAWTLIIATIVITVGAGALVLGRRKAPALALMVMVLGVVGVGAGSADAGVPVCEPVCFDIPDDPESEVPESDLWLEANDGVHITGSMYQSTDGTCTGDNEVFGLGVIADSQEEAEDLCGGPVVNLLEEIPAGSVPTPASNLWGCLGED